MNLLEWNEIVRVFVLACFALFGECVGFYFAWIAFRSYIKDLQEALRVLEVKDVR